MQLDIDSIRALNQIANDRGIEMNMILSGLEAALVSAYKKYQSPNRNIEVKIDPENGEVSVKEVRTIVEDSTSIKNSDTEITVQEALIKGFKNPIPGEVIKIDYNPKNFGRIAAQTARQVITQRLRDAERLMVFSEFADKVGEMITGTVFKPDGDQIIIRLNERTDALLPRKERIQGEKYIPGLLMKFYILEVKQLARGPRILVSRTHPGLLRHLMELEIPEIQQGIIEIKNIVRDGGTRAKVALSSLDPNVDPLGACIGNGGIRIKAVSSAIRNEKIDIVIWSSDPSIFIRNALSPAQIAKIEINTSEENSAVAYVYPDQLSLAIGKLGQNVRLAAKLTGWKIDIKTIEPDRMPTLKDIFKEAIDKPEKTEKNEIPVQETKIKKSRSASKNKAIREAFDDAFDLQKLDSLDALDALDAIESPDTSVNIDPFNEDDSQNQGNISESKIFFDDSDEQNKKDIPSIKDIFK